MKLKLTTQAITSTTGINNPNRLYFINIEEFELDERIELVKEVYEVLNLAQSTNDWDEVSAVIHEWRETAIAISSEELGKAFAEK